MSEPVLEIGVAEQFDPPVGNRTWIDQHRRRSHSRRYRGTSPDRDDRSSARPPDSGHVRESSTRPVAAAFEAGAVYIVHPWGRARGISSTSRRRTTTSISSRLRPWPASSWPQVRARWTWVWKPTAADQVFRHLVLARIIEPTSKLDPVRVLEEAGMRSCPTAR